MRMRKIDLQRKLPHPREIVRSIDLQKKLLLAHPREIAGGTSRISIIPTEHATQVHRNVTDEEGRGAVTAECNAGGRATASRTIESIQLLVRQTQPRPTVSFRESSRIPASRIPCESMRH